MADWRNRIVKHAEVAPGELTPNPLNWRAHPKQQADALAGLIETVGWVDDVIVNVTTGNILDGHLRVKLAQERNEPTVPVKYVELSEDEENLVLASFDPITGLAEMDATALAELLGRVDMQAIEDDGLASLLEELAADVDAELEEDEETETSDGSLLGLVDITIAEPTHVVEKGDIWAIGPHILACVEVLTDWPLWSTFLKEGVIFCPYPGPFVALSLRADQSPLVLVQPDTYIAGHIIDRYAEIKGESNVKKTHSGQLDAQ